MPVASTFKIYPAPAIQEATPAKESTIRSLLKAEPNSALLYFTLGNLQFRDEDYGKAIESYQKSLACELNNPLVMSNIALSYFRKDNSSESLVWAQRASGYDKSLILPQLIAAVVLKDQQKFQEAEDQIASILQEDPNIAEAYELLAALARDSGDSARSYKLAKQAFQRDDTKKHVRDDLCICKFEQGKKYFLEDSRIAAYAEWAEGYTHYGESFSECREVVVGMRELASDFSNSNAYKVQLAKAKENIRGSYTDKVDYYLLFLDFFFSVGLLPEVFEYRHLLEERLAHWLSIESGDGVQPYAKFRRIAIECYSGNLDTAREELLTCMDVLPDKKHHSLRLSSFYTFVSELMDAVHQQLPTRLDATEQQWTDAGFKSEFEIVAWRKTGLMPDDAARWRDSKFRAQDTVEWLRQKVSLSDAISWIDAGYDDPKVVKRWLRGEIAPKQARRWEEEFNAEVDDIIIWLKQGFSDPVEAKAWRDLFSFPWVAQQWKDNGFDLEASRGWINSGIKDPFAALRIAHERAQAAEDEAES